MVVQTYSTIIRMIRKGRSMKYRKRLGKKRSKKLFTKTAKKVNKRNFNLPMRGGLRM